MGLTFLKRSAIPIITVHYKDNKFEATTAQAAWQELQDMDRLFET